MSNNACVWYIYIRYIYQGLISIKDMIQEQRYHARVALKGARGDTILKGMAHHEEG